MLCFQAQSGAMLVLLAALAGEGAVKEVAAGTTVRDAIAAREEMAGAFATRLEQARQRLDARNRKPRAGGPRIDAVWATAIDARTAAAGEPDEVRSSPGARTTLRGQLGRVLGYYNQKSGGALLTAAADLLGSTSIDLVASGFPPGFFLSRQLMAPRRQHIFVNPCKLSAFRGCLVKGERSENAPK